MKEVWKDITEYEGLYQVSNFGRVKSLAKKDRLGHIRIERMMKLGKRHKYLGAWIRKDNVVKPVSVHRIVAKVFIPNPDNKPQVNHKDRNTLNNSVNNLEWCTQLENMKHAEKNNPFMFRKKPIIQMINGKKINIFESALDAQRKTGIDNSAIQKCCKNQRKLASGFQWKYLNQTICA